MALEKKIFGYLPISRGDWVQGTTYYQFNEVFHNGSTFMAQVDGVATEPTAVRNNDGTYTVSEGWTLVAYGVGTALDETYARIADLESGDLVVAEAEKANDLIGNASSRSEESGSFLIRTTAGDLDIDSDQPARLESIQGRLDDECHPFLASAFHWSGFNLLNPSQYIANADISGSTIISGSSNVYFFRVPKLTWGEYGTNEQNNGVLFTDNEGNHVIPQAIAYFTGQPAMSSVGSAPTANQSHSKTYYTTIAEGYLAVVLPSSLDVNNVCAHLAWDNEFDDEFEVFSAGSTIDLSWFWNDSRLHSWGMAGIAAGGNVVSDEIIFDEDIIANRKLYRRIGRVLMTNLSWSMEVGENSNTFTATIGSDMFSGGVFKIPLALGDFTCDGTTLKFVSSTIDSVSAFLERIAGAYCYYQLADPVVVSHSISGQGICNDMGIEEFVGASYPTNFTSLTYIVGLKFFLQTLASDLPMDFEAVITVLFQLQSDLESLRQRIVNLGKVKAVKIDNELIPSLSGYDFIKYGSGAPDVAPDFVGQVFIDQSNMIAYIGCEFGAGDWRRITNA